MVILAYCYHDGEGTEKNLEKAFYWFQKGAENGNEIAINNLASCYENGEGTEKNLEKAFYWYQIGAENGDEDETFNLALCYENGEGTEKNLEKAYYWYQKAAEIGNVDAMVNLAYCYHDGKGTEKNLEKAFYWFQKVAENGNKDAMDILASCYENGEGTEKNLEKALYWHQKAAANDDEISMNNLTNYDYNGKWTEKDLEESLYWHRKAIENGNNKAMLNLAMVSNNKYFNIKNELLCHECGQPYINYQWCQQCNSKRFQQDFSKWTSKNEFIDEFIRDAQLNAKDSYEVLEWIPYNKLSSINYHDKGGFSEIHKAIWLDGPIDSWNFDKQLWNRSNSQTGYEVILKILNNSSSLNNKDNKNNNRFLDEWKYHYNLMSYARKGSLRKCLSDIVNFKWQVKLQLLKKIISGLKTIHESNLTHGDFHDDLMKKCWDSNPTNRPTVAELEYKISEWSKCINEYYKINRDENDEIYIPKNIDSKLINDMLEFVEANNALVQEQDNIPIIQSHSQAYYTSGKHSESSDHSQYMIND
ncbi:kinase-like domain-containing protein [Rhizophagus clarus]|uniref:Kinase-like domain-containing protein n=1 Tax=Rhizophagus clarus TaxID=94130 RepID=A0A8H3KVS2_9GLOM|nr:kinase-like domain-containing protein [Rhizophagus clarus]